MLHKFNDRFNASFEVYATRYKNDDFLKDINDNLKSESFFNQSLLRPEFQATYAVNEWTTIIGGMGITREDINRTYFSIKPVSFCLSIL